MVPWIEASTDLGLDLDAEQKADPRTFKSHLGWDDIPKGGRYIVVLRDPADAAVSAFKFMEGWFVEPGSISVDEFVNALFLGQRKYYAHLKSWWAQRERDDVLLMAYEHMLANPEQAIERIADFAGIELDDELRRITLEHSSIDYMLTYKDRFDDALMRQRAADVAGLPADSDSAKVRAGKAGSGTVLSDQTRRNLAMAWEEEIAGELGLADYSALLAALSQPGR